jgi:hypothetical protein
MLTYADGPPNARTVTTVSTLKRSASLSGVLNVEGMHEGRDSIEIVRELAGREKQRRYADVC